jgi:hypothetical protein
MTPDDPALYEAAKKTVNQSYDKPSAYRSMAYIKEYKKNGGGFIPDGKTKSLKRWRAENWQDVNPNKSATSYPVYRPTIRINDKTPVTAGELSKAEITKQSKRKQKIKGTANLKPFKKK